MISNRFSYCLALLATIFILTSCLGSGDDVGYEFSSDAQIISIGFSSREDTLNVLPKVAFSINQVASAPTIFNKDSLPYLFDVSMAKMQLNTNDASGIKLHLNNPDSVYIWNMTDSVMISNLKNIEVYAQDGITKKMYTFILNTHQQDPDTIFWQNVESDYITTPIDQVTVSNKESFFTYYSANNTISLSTSPITDGESWAAQPLVGLPQNVVFKSIQNHSIEESEVWCALGTDNKVYISQNGIDWEEQATNLPVISILGRFPSFNSDFILAIVKDGDKYKFAKTLNFSSMAVLNEIPSSFPVHDFAFTTVNIESINTAKYLIATGGRDIDGVQNSKVWMLQEDGDKIAETSTTPSFDVKGSSLFNYDDKVYLLTSEDNKNQFYTSSTYGLVWEKASKKQSLPNGFLYRRNQSVNVDNINNIWIFGGESPSQGQLVEVWKGRINKLFVE